MLYFFKILSLIFILNCQALAVVHKADSLEEIEKIIAPLLSEADNKNTLFVFSLENFILQYNHPAILETNNELYETLLTNLLEDIGKNKISYLLPLMLTQYNSVFLPDQNIAKLITIIQNHSFPVMVITDNLTGSFNNIPYLEVWTYLYLAKIGIDLKLGNFADTQLLIDDDSYHFAGTYPSFYRGVLSSNGSDMFLENGVSLLLPFLLEKKLNWIPTNIVVMDNNSYFLTKMSEQLLAINNNINFIGISYKQLNDDLKDTTISSQEYMSFWTEIIQKLKNVKRKEESIQEEIKQEDRMLEELE